MSIGFAKEPLGNPLTPRGPKGEKRPADTHGAVVKAARIAVAEDATPESEGKDPAAVALGRRGGKARAAALSKRKRREIARKAAQTRWK